MSSRATGVLYYFVRFGKRHTFLYSRVPAGIMHKKQSVCLCVCVQCNPTIRFQPAYPSSIKAPSTLRRSVCLFCLLNQRYNCQAGGAWRAGMIQLAYAVPFASAALRNSSIDRPLSAGRYHTCGVTLNENLAACWVSNNPSQYLPLSTHLLCSTGI